MVVHIFFNYRMQKILANTKPQEIACSTPIITGKLDAVS